MAKPFRSDKRRKEVLRLKKQEEKRQRRFGKLEPEQQEENQDTQQDTQVEGTSEEAEAGETREDE